MSRTRPGTCGTTVAPRPLSKLPWLMQLNAPGSPRRKSPGPQALLDDLNTEFEVMQTITKRHSYTANTDL